MAFIGGFAIWLVVGLIGAFVMRAVYRGPDTTPVLTIAFGIFGAFIGGMLGTSAYVFHDPTPMRFGGILGAVLGAIFFTFVYNIVAKKFV